MNTKICITCKQEKPIDQFNKCARKTDGYNYECKKCASARERIRYYSKIEKHRKHNREYMQQKYANMPNTEKTIFLEKLSVKRQRDKIDLKIDVFNAYGARCECCGEDHFEFLTIDHIQGGGRAHRKKIGNGKNCSSQQFYTWLKKEDYPKDDFRILCWNCNCARGFSGYCPHTLKGQKNERV